MYPKIKNDFFAELQKFVDASTLSELEKTFPSDWTVEYKFGDLPNAKNGNYTIPFFSRIMLDETKREIETLGFKGVVVSFIELGKPPK